MLSTSKKGQTLARLTQKRLPAHKSDAGMDNLKLRRNIHDIVLLLKVTLTLKSIYRRNYVL